MNTYQKQQSFNSIKRDYKPRVSFVNIENDLFDLVENFNNQSIYPKTMTITAGMQKLSLNANK